MATSVVKSHSFFDGVLQTFLDIGIMAIRSPETMRENAET